MKLIKSAIFIFIFLLVFAKDSKALNTGDAYGMNCPIPPLPELNFSMKKSRTKFDFSSDTSKLTNDNLSKDQQGAGWINEGIMKSKFPNYLLWIDIEKRLYPDFNKACYWVSRINFKWVYSPVISIANDYPKYSCKYNSVIRHERQHVEIDIAILSKYKDAIKKNLQIQARNPIATGLVNTSDEEAIKQSLLNTVKGNLQQIVNKMVAERNTKQGSIDTVESYKALAAECADK